MSNRFRSVWRWAHSLVAVGAIGCVGLAQPGVSPPAGLVVKVETAGRLRSGQSQQLVWIENAAISSVESFVSNTGLRHLRFSFTAEGETFRAIMFAGEWEAEDERRLLSGDVHLMGIGDTFRNEPSFLAKWVEPSSVTFSESPDVAGPGDAKPTIVRIDGAETFEVTKFVSSSLRMHARFGFRVDGYEEAFRGIVYEGVWNTELLDALRAGRANLIGYWEEYEGDPSFVLTGVQ